MEKHLPATWETWVQSLGWKDPLEKEIATHSNTLAWKIPWTEEPGRLQSMGLQRVRHNWATSLHFLVKMLESPLDCKETKPVSPKGNQPWIFMGRTDVEAETPILWPPDAKRMLIWKDPDAGKEWRQEEKGTTEDEMVGWHHRLNWHEIPGVGDAIQLSHPLLSPSPPAFTLSQHHGLF